MNHKFENALAAILIWGLTVTPISKAGIPVVDSVNLGQNLLIAIETVDQTLRQIQQYQTQISQWHHQIRNTLAPSVYIWVRAREVMDNLIYTVDSISHYENWIGSLDSYLAKFQSVDYYRSSPCFQPGGCTETEKASLEANQRLTNDSQKKANDAFFRAIRQQQNELRENARTLERLQNEAEREGGNDSQMKALGYANQFAAKQNAQLLQIRGMMIAQQNVLAVQAAQKQDQMAQDQAIERAMTQGTYRRTAPQTFTVGGAK